MELNKETSRRGFLNLILGGGAVAITGTIIYPLIRYLIPPPTTESGVTSVLVGKVSDLTPNQGKIFKFGTKPGILIRTSEGKFKAFNAICTHLECTVQYRSDMKLIWCACHNGKYNLNGINIAGPPPRPLTPLVVHIRGEDIYVSPQV
jgi:Rieske Fe-S protein